MRVFRGLHFILLIKLFILCRNILGDEILGCGGFIKSHAEIDFSKVEIKLLTKQGSLKDKTDCSPSNGYYFLPIYDKGEYLLKISPPPGWSFVPEEVELNFDGKTDICSQGKDVNFSFRGFGITGKVALAGTANTGIRAIDIELIAENGKDIRRTKTDLNGIFSFSPIIPGKYLVKATHNSWHFAKDTHSVVVTSGNTVLPDDAFIISGFDVVGHFFSTNGLSSGIGVALFQKVGQTLSSKCTQTTAIKNTIKNANYEANSICYAELDTSGSYLFNGVAPGQYLVQPIVTDTKLKLHISPSFIEFGVKRDTHELSEQFKITGFSINGRVLTSSNGFPIKSAIIKLNGKPIAETDSNGSFTLQNINAGSYRLLAESSKLEFNEQNIKIQLNTPTLPDMIPSGYEVCGKIVSKKSYVLGITKHGSTFHTTVSSKAETGEWCTYLPNGKFSVEVLTTDVDKTAGIQFFPVQQIIEVNSEPLNGITFSQLRAKLLGEIECLADASEICTASTVTLLSLDSTGKPTGQSQSVNAVGGKYVFKEILPGPYEISIPQTNLCFDSIRVFINVASVTEKAPPFVHRGYEVNIVASHRAVLKYNHISVNTEQKPTIETLKLLSGMNTFCVQKSGQYSIKLESCHLYENNTPNTFATTNQNPVIINAIAHRVGVRILSTESTLNDLKLGIESNTLNKQLITPIAESHKVDGKYAYRYDTYLKPQEKLILTPQSEILLFTPQLKEIIGGNDCIDIAYNFIAIRGLILRGKILPPISNAKITLTFPQNAELTTLTAVTTANGEFRFGPIDGNLKYELNAEKESYVFSEYNRETSTFNAHKLCEIIVNVKDENGKQLNGVLLSLSGAESYRKNLMTGDNGIMNFHSLSPSQYFLRPVMKEYKFEPNSKIIDIKDGETVEVNLIGKRVAYSVFGTITTLSGEPFPKVNIEAIADENCQYQQEEASSELNGQYRIRGLQPNCIYNIKLKSLDVQNTNVERTIPQSQTITVGNEDIQNINLIAISPIELVDVNVRVTATLNDHYKTLRLIVYRRGSQDSPIYSQKIETPLNPKGIENPGILVYLPRIALDGKSYVAELKSTLSDKTYTYITPIQTFIANTSSIYVELNFKPEVRTVESDINQNSLSALILVALVAIAFFRQDLAVDFLNFVWSRLNSLTQDLIQRHKNNTKKDLRRNEPISQKEIDLLADQINSIKRKKTKKI